MRQLDGITDSMDESEQTLGDSEGQGSLACCSPWGCKVQDMTQRLNNKDLPISMVALLILLYFFKISFMITFLLFEECSLKVSVSVA